MSNESWSHFGKWRSSGLHAAGRACPNQDKQHNHDKVSSCRGLPRPFISPAFTPGELPRRKRRANERDTCPTTFLLESNCIPHEVVALDEDTGNTLWQFKTGSSVNATPITFTHKGQQYISIASGLGGQLAGRIAGQKVPRGGSLWTFALMPE